MVGNGVQNIVSAFFSGYPSTGTLSRTTLNLKCGDHTPLGGCKLIYIVKNVVCTKYRSSCVDRSVVIIIPRHPVSIAYYYSSYITLLVIWGGLLHS